MQVHFAARGQPLVVPGRVQGGVLNMTCMHGSNTPRLRLGGSFISVCFFVLLIRARYYYFQARTLTSVRVRVYLLFFSGAQARWVLRRFQETKVASRRMVVWLKNRFGCNLHTLSLAGF